MNKIIDIIFNALFTLLFIFCFSNSAISLVKNINKDNSFFPSILLMILIVYLIIIVEQYKILRNLCKNYKNEK